MLLRLFIIFYNTELVDEDVFLQWKEDINETYAGKGKALFQVKLSALSVSNPMTMVNPINSQ